MREVTVDEILRDYYYAIDASKLSEDNIVIDENLVVEDSKNKYLQEFAHFLNDSYWKGYKISDSIIAKLMNIIEYEGYEYQIIKQYIKILDSAIVIHKEDNIPVCVDLDPLKCIEYINLYLNAKDYNIPYYVYNHTFKTNTNPKIYTLTEISDPTPMIVKDMQEWIENHSEE